MSRDRGIVSKCTEGESTIHLELKQRSARYFDEWFGMRCGADLHALGIYPNAKEVTESMAAKHALRRILGQESAGWRNVVCWCIGDGASPRTGALLAFTTRWKVVSIDPRLRQFSSFQSIDRLTVVSGKAEDYDYAADGGAIHLIVGVHSHAPWNDIWNRTPERKIGVAIPCCVPHSCVGFEIARYYDWGIWSPCREVIVWADEDGRKLCKGHKQ